MFPLLAQGRLTPRNSNSLPFGGLIPRRPAVDARHTRQIAVHAACGVDKAPKRDVGPASTLCARDTCTLFAFQRGICPDGTFLECSGLRTK